MMMNRVSFHFCIAVDGAEMIAAVMEGLSKGAIPVDGFPHGFPMNKFVYKK